MIGGWRITPTGRPRAFARSLDLAARMRQAPCNPIRDQRSPEQNDRSCAVRSMNRLRDVVGDSDNHVRVPVDDLASDLDIPNGRNDVCMTRWLR